jgi:hypothetical protein
VIDPEHKLANLYCLTNGRYVLTTLQIKDTIISEALPGLALPLAGIFPSGVAG